MKTLNRPMFRYGGPIKEGIMDGMKEKQAINTVGSPLAPKDETGRGGYAFPLIGAGLSAAARFLPAAYRGFKGARYVGPTDKGLTGMQRFRNLFPTQNFRSTIKPSVSIDKATGRVIDKGVPGQLSIKEAFTNPQIIGRAIRENPLTAFGVAGQVKNIPDIASGAVGLAADTGLAATNYLLGTDFKRGQKKDELKTTDGTGIKRGDKNKVVATPETGGTGGKSDAEKQIINEDRIQENKNKYYKLMGIDKMNKEATYDSLIDASKIIQEKGGDLKGSIKDGSLQSSLISAISKNLDKSSNLKKQIDAAVLKAEIQKDINQTKPSAFAEQVQYIRNNPNDPLAKKLSGMRSVADDLAGVKTGELTSDLVGRLVQSKGQKITDILDDTKFQKWEKNNENKDEIDYLQELSQGQSLDAGIYIINKKAFRVDEDGDTFPVDLDTIIG